MELVEEVDKGKLCANSNTTTPRLVLPPSEHLQTIEEKASDVELAELEVSITAA